MKENTMRATLLVSVLLIFICTGCATERYVSPTIATTPRTAITLKNPILTAVYDGRTSGEDQGAASSLKAELTQIYGTNLQWTSYFELVPNGSVSLKFRIIELGSSFGSRLISSATYATAIQSAQVSTTGPWGTVVGNAAGSSSVYGGSFSGEGWWNGAAWIDIEIQDNRSTHPRRFTLPLAAEHRESNMWGYSSGDKAANKAWGKVSAQLTRVIDEVLRVLRDSESEQA